MKKIIRAVLVFLTVLGLFLTQTGCTHDGIDLPKNRTQKEVEFEDQFWPIKDFLAQEKKDFEGIKSYFVSITIRDDNEMQRYTRLYLDTEEMPFKGELRIDEGRTSEEKSVQYINNELIDDNSEKIALDSDFFNLNISKEFFTNLKIEKTIKSFETTLNSIEYEKDTSSNLYKYLIKKYNFPKESYLKVQLENKFNESYSLSMNLKSDKKDLSMVIEISPLKK